MDQPPPAQAGGIDPWGEFIHFLRFLSSSGSCETLQDSLSFLAAHPLNVPAVSRQDLMILENGIEEHWSVAEEDNNNIEREEIHGMGDFSMIDKDALDVPTPPSIPHNISNSSSNPVANLQCVAATLGITLPSGYNSILCQLKLIQECLTLSGAPAQCLEHLCYQDTWSRNMLVQSFVHLPWLL